MTKKEDKKKPIIPKKWDNIKTKKRKLDIAVTICGLFVKAKLDKYDAAVTSKINGPIKPLFIAFCPINNPPNIITIFWT